jgi:hypothetical protein
VFCSALQAARLHSKAMPLDSETAGPQQFVSEDQLTSLYGWLDEIPLSRAKRNICRDFADVSSLFVDAWAPTHRRDGACRVNARKTLVVLDHTQKLVTCSFHRPTRTQSVINESHGLSRPTPPSLHHSLCMSPAWPSCISFDQRIPLTCASHAHGSHIGRDGCRGDCALRATIDRDAQLPASVWQAAEEDELGNAQQEGAQEIPQDSNTRQRD